MYISKKDRELIKYKFGGKCAYSGTELKEDWQVDHVKPIIRNWYSKGALFEESHNIDNMIPCQKIINHYKGSLDLETFRNWYLGELHERLKKLPKNPKTEKSIKRKNYLLEVASLFDITEDKPFNKKFYFETL
jgi:5-methylcytosine-specific restriction endonuclease McrA